MILVECGQLIESPRHFFLECPRYAGIRNNMITSISEITDCNINSILFGNINLDYSDNKIFFNLCTSILKIVEDSK